jgi:hypothetical protein
MACNGHSWEPLSDVEERPAKLPDQIEVAYNMLRSGSTEVEIRLAIQERFGKAAKPTQAFRRGLDLVIQEQREARQHLPELVMALRWRAIQQGLATGELGAVAGMLRDAGAACGEAALDAAGATLTVQVLEPGAGQNTTAPAQQLQEAA